MDLIATSPAELAQWSAVSLWEGAEFLGSGFFIEERVVVTCAHVVWQSGSEVTVSWRGQDLPATVIEVNPPRRGDGAYYAMPDVALVLVHQPPDHPVARLTERVAMPNSLSVAGFSKDTPSATGFGPDSALVTYEGRTADGLWKVKDGQVLGGMSGAPAFDRATGEVFGVVKASRDYGQAAGGWIIPIVHVQQMRTRLEPVLGRHVRSLPRFRPAPDSPLADLLTAQWLAADRMPYRLAIEGQVPKLSTVYVKQTAQRRHGIDLRGSAGYTLKEVLKEHRHVLLTGGAGVGKSSLTQQVVGDIARWWLDADPAEPPRHAHVLPLRVPAQHVSQAGVWSDRLLRAVHTDLGDYLPRRIDPAIFDEMVASGQTWLVFVDGLDEIADHARRADVIRILGDRIRSYGDGWRLVITSRLLGDREFGGLHEHLLLADFERRFGEYELRLFDRPALESFASAWFRVRIPPDGRGIDGRYLREVHQRGLFPTVQVPLLATITAVVLESRPERDLPSNRTGLYQRFIKELTFARKRRDTLKNALAQHFAPWGQPAEAVGQLLFDQTEQCLEHVAQQWLADPEGDAVEAALQWLLAQRPEARRLELRPVLREMLIGTGLLHPVADRLTFTHRGFAEYLASGGTDPLPIGRMLRSATAGQLRNADLFRLARWSESAGDDATFAELNRLLQPGLTWRWPFVVIPHLLTLCAVLNDGLQLSDDVMDRLSRNVLRVVRWMPVRGEESLSSLVFVLRSVQNRKHGRAWLAALAGDDGVHPVKRLAAARVLNNDDPTRETAARTFAGMSTQPQIKPSWRYRAAAHAAICADDEQAGKAVGTLAEAIFQVDVDHSAPRMEALNHLQQIGQQQAGQLALVMTALSLAFTPGQRDNARSELYFLHDLDDNHQGTYTLHGSPMWLVSDIIADDPPLAQRLAVASATHEPEAWFGNHGHKRQFLAAFWFFGYTAKALAEDEFAPMHHRARALRALYYSELDEDSFVYDQLSRWALDENRPPAVRRLAVDELRHTSQARAAVAIAVRVALDAGPVLLRLEMAQLVARQYGLPDLGYALIDRVAGDRRLTWRQRLLSVPARLGLAADPLTQRLAGRPPRHGRTISEPAARLAAAGWQAFATAPDLASPPTTSAREAMVTHAATPDPAPAASSWDSAREAMVTHAATLRLHLSRAQRVTGWADNTLAASIGASAANKAQQLMGRFEAGSVPVPALLTLLSFHWVPSGCPWWKQLRDGAWAARGPDRAARVALAWALKGDAARISSRSWPARITRAATTAAAVGAEAALMAMVLALCCVTALLGFDLVTTFPDGHLTWDSARAYVAQPLALDPADAAVATRFLAGPIVSAWAAFAAWHLWRRGKPTASRIRALTFTALAGSIFGATLYVTRGWTPPWPTQPVIVQAAQQFADAATRAPSVAALLGGTALALLLAGWSGRLRTLPYRWDHRFARLALIAAALTFTLDLL